MEYYRFPCGCEWPIIGEPLVEGALPLMEVDSEKMPDCPAVWDMLGRGFTKGVFQLESNLGKKWCKRLKPENIEHLSAMGSILRPGSLLNKDADGISMTEHYCRRKNNEEPNESLHPALDEILSDTYNCLIYQEQIMAISSILAGFPPVKVDELRKAVGKKSYEALMKLKDDFINGCVKVGKVNEEQAKTIWSGIEKSGRYSFNKCLSPLTLVETLDGLKTLSEVQIGEKITSPTGLCEVMAKYHNGEKMLWRAKFKSGKSIDCTLDHKFMCKGSYVYTLEQIHKEKKQVCTIDGLDTIDKIFQLGVFQTIDIEVNSKNHIFFGNGIATSNSHATSYALLGYDTAYLKCHWPVSFIANWLTYAKYKPDKEEEINALIEEAKFFDIPIKLPDITALEKCIFEQESACWYDQNGQLLYSTADEKIKPSETIFGFAVDGNSIKFGLQSIKGVGKSHLIKMHKHYVIAKNVLGKPINEWTWEEFLYNFSSHISSNVMEGLIFAGALSMFGKTRLRMKNEYVKWIELTDGEQKWVTTNTHDASLAKSLLKLGNIKKDGGGCHNKKRVDFVRGMAHLLENPPSSECDHPTHIYLQEKRFLTIAISATSVDTCDTSAVNTTCKEFVDGKKGPMMIGVSIVDKREFAVKNGKSAGSMMAYLTVTDGSCTITNVVVFSDVLEQYKDLLEIGNTVLLQGVRDNRDSFLVERVWDI